MTLTMLVLPEPFGPTSPNISPCPISKLTPLSARSPPNASSMSRHRRTASGSCAAMLIVSHPEHAVMRRRDRGIQRDADGHAERIAGIDGIENAIVPHFRGGIIGALMAAVFLEDRVADRIDLVGRQCLSCTRE